MNARLRRLVRTLRRGLLSPVLSRLPLVVLVVLASTLPFAGDLAWVSGRALASLLDPAQQASALRIVSPSESTIVGDGNLVLVEGTAIDRVDGVVDRVELAFDTEESWTTAERTSADPNGWRYLWSDPSPGFHRIRARAFGIEGAPVVEQSVVVKVEEGWSTAFVVDNPYASRGTFHKGQLHVHSTNSFDGWESLPPAHLALEYKRRGYGFVVITDHDVVSYPSEVNDGTFLAIPGYESTSESGHITGAFVKEVVSPALGPQQRIDHIVSSGGIALLNHPGWRVGWNGTDFRTLRGAVGFEVFNAVTSRGQESLTRNLGLWHEALNTKGWQARMWAVAVDDAHDLDWIDRGWVVAKSAELTEASIRKALEQGALYASNGPSFSALGVMGAQITAASPDAATVRFIAHDGRVVGQGPASWASYRPTGAERWIRVEAVRADGATAWSQPFWILPNAPKVSFVPTWAGMALMGQTLVGARVHVSDRGEYLGNVVANDQGQFVFSRRDLAAAPHDFWVVASSPWPDDVNSLPALLKSPDRSSRP